MSALRCALRHPRTPRRAKIVAALVVAYALSPIDLIPDFIPVLGYLDDLVLLPLGIALAIRLVPPDVMAACREESAADPRVGRAGPTAWFAGAAIAVIWVAVLGLLALRAYRMTR